MAVEIKSKTDIEKMRATCRLAASVLEFIEPHVVAGVTTREIDRLCHEYIVDHGHYPAPLNYRGFPGSVCTSVNEVTCHGVPGDRVLRDVDIGGPHRTVQALVEEEVGVGRQRLPLGEGAGRLAIGCGLVLAVQVLARVSRAGFAVTPEQGFEFREQVRFRTEMTEAVVAAGPFLGHALLHLGAVVAMEAVAFDEGGVHPFATEDLIEGPHH